MSKVVHTLKAAYVSVSVLVLYICSLHTPKMRIKAGEVHAVLPGSCMVRSSRSGGALMRLNTGP